MIFQVLLRLDMYRSYIDHIFSDKILSMKTSPNILSNENLHYRANSYTNNSCHILTHIYNVI